MNRYLEIIRIGEKVEERIGIPNVYLTFRRTVTFRSIFGVEINRPRINRKITPTVEIIDSHVVLKFPTPSLMLFENDNGIIENGGRWLIIIGTGESEITRTKISRRYAGKKTCAQCSKQPLGYHRMGIESRHYLVAAIRSEFNLWV